MHSLDAEYIKVAYSLDLSHSHSSVTVLSSTLIITTAFTQLVQQLEL